MHKWIGSIGTFGQETVSRGSTGVPDDFPIHADGKGNFIGGESAHNAAVFSYLTGAGLPADQVLSISADNVGISKLDGTLLAEGWQSILLRGFRGTPIEGSTAWALLGSKEESLEEQVFWPAIDHAAVKELETLEAILADDGRRSQFLSRLPNDLMDGHLSINHTSWYWQGPFEAHACYEGKIGNVIACFDPSGHLVEMPDAGGATAP